MSTIPDAKCLSLSQPFPVGRKLADSASGKIVGQQLVADPRDGVHVLGELARTPTASPNVSPSNRLLGETDGFLEVFGELCRRPEGRGPVVHDARVAALCLVHGMEALLTRDRDFALFPELDVQDPFVRGGAAKWSSD